MQEGVLAKALHFWFKGGALSFEELQERFQKNSDYSAGVGTRLLRHLKAWRFLYTHWESDGVTLETQHEFSTLQSALQYRATSKRKDEAIREILVLVTRVSFKRICNNADTDTVIIFVGFVVVLPSVIVIDSRNNAAGITTIRSRGERLGQFLTPQTLDPSPRLSN